MQKINEMYRNYLKIILDFILALVGIGVLLPIFIVVALVLLIAHQENPFFIQWRVGLNGKLFKIIKFRTMNNKKDNAGNLLPDEQRLTKIGQLIRKYSLDELPQLSNVLKGEMSLVGTRPPTVDEWEKYEPHHRARMSVKPGLTGMWQVYGRADVPDFEQVVRLDTEYIKNWSLKLDTQLLLKTIRILLK